MSPLLLITAIIFYILSLVISLVMMIISKNINAQWRKVILLFHLFLSAAALVSFLFFKDDAGIIFMIFFCFGIAAAGMVIRSSSVLLLKIIYALFLSSVLIFLYSPSLLLSLLIQQKFPETKGTEFLLRDNYYLAKEQSLLGISKDKAKYKIIRRTGKFNKTMKRNISFGHEIDSLKVLSFDSNKNILLRGFFSPENKMTDSIDVTTDLIMTDANEIIRKKALNLEP
jgi:hypothetical protein